jgi:hypothetical protein
MSNISFSGNTVFDYSSARKAADQARLGWICSLEIVSKNVTREAMALIPEILLQPGSKIEKFTFHPLFAEDLVGHFLRYHGWRSDPAGPRRLTIHTSADSPLYARTFIWLARLTGCDELILHTRQTFLPVALTNPPLAATTAPYLFKLHLMRGDLGTGTIPEFASSCRQITEFHSTYTPGIDDMHALSTLPVLSTFHTHMRNFGEAWERAVFPVLMRTRTLQSIKLPVSRPLSDGVRQLASSLPRLREFYTGYAPTESELAMIILHKNDRLAQIAVLVASRLPMDMDLVRELAGYL